MKKSTILIICCVAIIILFLVLVYPRPGFPIHVHAPMHIVFLVSCLAILFAGMSIIHAHAESPGPNRHGFTGLTNPPPPPPPPPGGPSFNPPPPYGFQETSGQYGFTGPSRTSTTVQALTFKHKAPVILSGNLVQSIGADLYTFRDSSGTITVRIGPLEWQNIGFNISPSDNIEINGEVHRDGLGSPVTPEVHVRFIKKI